MAAWLKAVFCPVKNKNLPINTHGCNDIRILRLISGFVDLSWMIYLLGDGHLDRWGISRRRVTIAANLSSFLIIVSLIWSDVLWQFDVGDFKVIWRIIGGMRTDQQSMGGVILVRKTDGFSKITIQVLPAYSRFDIGEPLCRQGRPFQCCAVGRQRFIVYICP